MQLYEEYELVEHLWDDPPEAALFPIPVEEGFSDKVAAGARSVFDFFVGFLKILQEILIGCLRMLQVVVDTLASALEILLHIIWQVILGIMKTGVFAWTVVEETTCLLISGAVQGIAALIEVAIVEPISVLTEDIDQDRLVAALSTFSFEELAQKDPMLRADLQQIVAALGPEQAQKAIAETEAQIRQQAEPLAKSLKNVKPEDLRDNKDKIVEIIQKQFEKEIRKLEKKRAREAKKKQKKNQN